jgi:hypothetical protein
VLAQRILGHERLERLKHPRITKRQPRLYPQFPSHQTQFGQTGGHRCDEIIRQANIGQHVAAPQRQPSAK